MANYLQQLLGAREPLFSAGLKWLEQATGNRGIDAKLIGDIHEAAYMAMRSMGLDPKDTTSRELWTALQVTYPKATLKNATFAGLVTVDGVVSFNANDVKRNKNHSFADRTTDSLRQELALELKKRYESTGRDTSAHISELMQDAGIKTLNLQQKPGGKET